MTAMVDIDRVAALVGDGDFFLWANDEETLLALGTRARVTLRDGSLRVAGHEPVPTRDPFGALPDLLARHAPPGWRAFGYVAFDACAFYRPYTKAASGAAIELLVPRATVRFTAAGAEIDAPADERGRIEAALAAAPAGAPASSRSPNLPTNLVEEGRTEYLAAVREAVARIRAGELQKVILSRHVRLPGRLDVFATHAAGAGSRAARKFVFAIGEARGVGLCPDVLLAADGRGAVETTPLAGTRPRGASPEDDARMVRELLADPKELSEHAMSILCAYEELATVCTPETLRVTDFMRVKTYPFTHHLTSKAQGTLASGRTSWDALRAVFPGVTASGVDKSAAISLIDRYELAPRGIYSGALGWVREDGAMDWGIGLRSAFEVAGRLTISAGAGIVADSDADYEFRESVNKLRTIGSKIVLA
jgi:salicylate synthetase